MVKFGMRDCYNSDPTQIYFSINSLQITARIREGLPSLPKVQAGPSRQGPMYESLKSFTREKGTASPPPENVGFE